MRFALLYLMLGSSGIIASLAIQPESRDEVELLILRIPLVAATTIYCLI